MAQIKCAAIFHLFYFKNKKHSLTYAVKLIVKVSHWNGCVQKSSHGLVEILGLIYHIQIKLNAYHHNDNRMITHPEKRGLQGYTYFLIFAQKYRLWVLVKTVIGYFMTKGPIKQTNIYTIYMI